MFRIEISTDGTAFKEPSEGSDDRFQEALEIKRILENIVGQIEYGMTCLMEKNLDVIAEEAMKGRC